MEKKLLGEELFFAKEAAEYLGITTQRLNKLVQEGKIHPLKKNASGAVYHIDELNRRKEELSFFSRVSRDRKKNTFAIDTKVKNEALNFATLINSLGYTENKLDPLFSEFAKEHDVSIPIPEKIKDYTEYYDISKDRLLRDYQTAKASFSCLKEKDEIIKRGSSDYPKLLLKTKQAPRFLYIRGKKSLLFETRTVALVGSRQASIPSRENTRRLAIALGRNGITVVSGLAKGIDVTAHKAALSNGFNTIAVIGTNLNQYYPIENKEVQLEIEERGLVISQFSPATKTERWFFPLRNGVMSGLSLATVIMEAGETSGALKQADFALKQGRQVIIPQKALEISTITWPRRFVEKGAITASNPAEVLRVLADNNIFHVTDKIEPVQQTLDYYFSDQDESNEDKLQRINPVLDEE